MPQPSYSKYLVLAAQDTVAQFLRERGLNHLKVTSRSRHVVIYSEEPDGEKVSRIRFCAVDHNQFRMDVTTHPGRWEPTPYEGPLLQLCDIALTDFPWILADF